jgi:hypothetical protein
VVLNNARFSLVSQGQSRFAQKRSRTIGHDCWKKTHGAVRKIPCFMSMQELRNTARLPYCGVRSKAVSVHTVIPPRHDIA